MIEELKNDLYEFCDELLDSNSKIKLKVGGYSMYPVLKNGDIITINKCKINELKTGEIVVFKTRDKWIAHRLLKIRNGNELMLITKGDTCKHKDPVFTEEDFAGKVISFSRKSKEVNLNNSFRKFVGIFIARLSLVLTPLFILNLWIINKLKSIKINLKVIFSRLKFISKSSGKLTWINIIISALQGIFPFVVIYMIKWLVDGISHLNKYPDKDVALRSVIIIIIITGVVFLCNSIINILNSEYRERLSQSISLYIYGLLHKKHSSLDIAYLEDSAQQDKIHRAVTEAGFRPLKMVSEGLSVLQSVISWVFVAIILFSIHWSVFILILLAVLPGFYVRFKFSDKLYKLNKSNSQKEREVYYYNRILTGLPFAKELRLFGTASFFKMRFDKIQKELYWQKNKLLHKRALSEVIAQSFAVVLTFLSFGIISVLAINGILSVGTVVLFFLIFQRGLSVLKDFFQSVAGLYEDNVFLSDFFEFLALPALHKEAPKSVMVNDLQKGIFVENVSFNYPSSRRKALDAVSISIPAGKTVALVGANGSGKTTLVKLLCGFYNPDSGSIMYDNTNISEVEPEEIRKKITAVFQDFVLYNMTAAENIFLGDTSMPASPEAMKQAAQNAGIADILESLPSGYDNIIGNLFENSEELSIGQWQKMAIARAFYRNSPILFMDEPTSALDAETELHLLQNLKSLAKEKTVLIISHRLSTIKWADNIYVLDNGAIIESGNHAQLMEKKGKYFNMFELNRMV